MWHLSQFLGLHSICHMVVNRRKFIGGNIDSGGYDVVLGVVSGNMLHKSVSFSLRVCALVFL